MHAIQYTKCIRTRVSASVCLCVRQHLMLKSFPVTVLCKILGVSSHRHAIKQQLRQQTGDNRCQHRCTYAHTHIRTHTHTYARTHAHTHTHLHAPPLRQQTEWDRPNPCDRTIEVQQQPQCVPEEKKVVAHTRTHASTTSLKTKTNKQANNQTNKQASKQNKEKAARREETTASMPCSLCSDEWNPATSATVMSVTTNANGEWQVQQPLLCHPSNTDRHAHVHTRALSLTTASGLMAFSSRLRNRLRAAWQAFH